MTLQQNTDRIQTTHIGSLPRPHRLLDMMKAKYSGQPYDHAAFEQTLRSAVAEIVRKQVECGIDIITDGELSKPGFFTYIRERLDGFESRPTIKVKLFEQEVAAFPEYYEQYFKLAMMGGTVVSLAPVVCIGPVKYRGHQLVADRHRQRKGRRRGSRSAQQTRLSARDGAVRHRHQRVLQVIRGVLSRARCSDERRIPRDLQRRHSGADR